MPPGNAVRLYRSADKTDPPPAGSHAWLPYSKRVSWFGKPSFLL